MARTEDNVIMFSVVRDFLLQGKCVNVSVQGNSMLPFFRSGSKVLIRPISDGDLKKYNVVLADTGKNFVIHRIINVKDNMVTLLGDGNIVGTETMHGDKVYGIIDCSLFHYFFARIWLLMRPIRRYPLAVFRRLM